MKNNFKLLLVAGIATLTLPVLSSCGGTKADYTLNIFNWEDYIATGEDEDGNKVGKSTIEEFETYFYEKHQKTIKVNYETFSTNEDVYNQLKLNAIDADLICPSDYMIQKMVKENMLEKFTRTDGEYDLIPNYNKYGSPYIKNLFDENNFSDYAIPYFWGTMGLTYNPNFNSTITEDVNTWDILWNSKYKGAVTVKDSVRDTIFTAVLKVYKSELDTYKTQFENGELTNKQYNNKLVEVFNRCDDATLAKVEKELTSLKSNIFGLEVDDGKNDIISGKIAVNLAWSGDAVYSMDVAEEENDFQLNYAIPEEGSNIWFDGWVAPKGAQMDLASEFLDFISRPDIAAMNMEYTGYTSAIAGQEIWDLANDWYSSEEGNQVDLSYFFEGTLNEGVEAIITVSERGRQFDAQYPDEKTIARCAIMKDFGDQTEKVYQIWNNFKSSN